MVNHPSMSCLLSAKLSWHTLPAGNKFTRKQQALKLSTHLYNLVGQDINLYPRSVFNTKLRVPGAGNVLQLRYEGEAGKPFRWLGVETNFVTRDKE